LDTASDFGLATCVGTAGDVDRTGQPDEIFIQISAFAEIGIEVHHKHAKG